MWFNPTDTTLESEGAMRIFLHVHDGAKIITDSEGSVYPSVQDAHADAVRSARELMGEGLKDGVSLFHYSIHATDENGFTRFYLPFLDAVPQEVACRRWTSGGCSERTRFARGEAPE